MSVPVSKPSKSSKRATETQDSAESLSFEQAVERVEVIIDRIESGESGLERSLVELEEGTRLLQRCREILAKAEQKVIELMPDGGSAPGVSGSRPRSSPGRNRAESPEEPPF